MIAKELMGRWSEPVRNVIEEGAVRKFADATCDPNLLYRDAEYASKTRHRRRIAPPTFSCTLSYGVVEGLQIREEGLIHGEQTFHFERPLYIGEEIYCSTRLADAYSRSGGNGKLTFLIYEQKGETAEGELIFTARMNVISKEGVSE